MKAKMNKWSTWITETRADVLYSQLEKLLLDAGFHIEGQVTKHFYPYGFTALFLLSESHFAIHTFPEEGKTYLELTSCVDTPYHRFLELFERWNGEP